MRVDLMDNGRQQGRAQWAAKLGFSTDATDGIDRYRLTARDVDFTTPTFFKRTMLNHNVGDLAAQLEDDPTWDEERRKLARDHAKEVQLSRGELREAGKNGL
jgi:hypothetical protein